MSAGFIGVPADYPIGPHAAPSSVLSTVATSPARAPASDVASSSVSPLATLVLLLLAVIMVVAVARRFWPASWSAARIFSLRHYETIRFVDGPLVGTTIAQRTTRGGLPPLQISPLVERAITEGGNYTLPYERGFTCEECHHWHYTEGWTNLEKLETGTPADLAKIDLESWLRR